MDYKIKNYIEKIQRENSTFFLDQRELKLLLSKLNNKKYKIYYPFENSDKCILYTNEVPKLVLFKIVCDKQLKHQDILGTLFSLNIDKSLFGDIFLLNDNFYFICFEKISNYIKDNLTKIANCSIILEENDISILESYKREYQDTQYIVSSLRIDNVISSIINSSRSKVIDKIKNKEVILNYEVLSKNSYVLKENDIFSIRKFGKYKFKGIKNTTKKNNLIIDILKYK